MKKSSLMGASVVAAALLAAAPVVAPVASLAIPGTQVVKATTTPALSTLTATGSASGSASGSVNETGLNNAINAVTNSLNGKQYVVSDPSTELNPDAADGHGFGHNFASAMGTFQDSQYLTGKAPFNNTNTNPFSLNNSNKSVTINDNLLSNYFFKNKTIQLINSDAGASLRSLTYGIRFHYSNAIGTVSTDVTSQAEVKSVLSDMRNNGGTVTLYLTLYDVHNKSVGSASASVSYNANNISAAYVKYDTTLNTTVGQSADQYNFVNSFANAGGSILDQNGNDVLKAAVDKGAVSVTNLRDVNDNTKPTTNADGNFAKAGSYYQQISINLGTAGVVVPKGDWASAVQNGLISVNGVAPSLNNVDSNAYLATSGVTINGKTYSKGTLVLKRVVNVSLSQGAFKSEKVSGIVTVNMNNGMAAQVYDENGKMVLGRALPNKSAWKTGEKRTYYKDGQVFYQVSTNEYVRAQDVTFSEPFQDSVVRGDVTITKYPDQVIATKNDDHYSIVYALDSDGNGFHMTSRALAGNTKWRNGAKAVVNGKIFYQISTNEWLNADSLAD